MRTSLAAPPLQYAVMSGSDTAVQHLLAAGADTAHVDHFGVTPLMLAAEAESDAILDELIKTGTDADKKDSVGDTALFYAARVGRTDHAQRLIAAGATFDQSNADGWTVLDVASKAGYVETAQALKKAGALGHLKASMMREGGGVDPTRGGELYQGWPPITIAASRNDARLVSELLAGGARPDEPTPHRDTPLLVAAKYRAAAVIAPLLKAGANPAHFDESGERLLAMPPRTASSKCWTRCSKKACLRIPVVTPRSLRYCAQLERMTTRPSSTSSTPALM